MALVQLLRKVLFIHNAFASGAQRVCRSCDQNPNDRGSENHSDPAERLSCLFIASMSIYLSIYVYYIYLSIYIWAQQYLTQFGVYCQEPGSPKLMILNVHFRWCQELLYAFPKCHELSSTLLLQLWKDEMEVYHPRLATGLRGCIGLRVYGIAGF